MQNDLACLLSFLFFPGQFQLIDFSPCYGLFFPASLYAWYFFGWIPDAEFCLVGSQMLLCFLSELLNFVRRCGFEMCF